MLYILWRFLVKRINMEITSWNTMHSCCASVSVLLRVHIFDPFVVFLTHLSDWEAHHSWIYSPRAAAAWLLNEWTARCTSRCSGMQLTHSLAPFIHPSAFVCFATCFTHTSTAPAGACKFLQCCSIVIHQLETADSFLSIFFVSFFY